MLTREDIESLLNKGGNIIGADGEKIGSAGQFYADDDTGEPTWVTVKTGLFGASQSFVPVEGARSEGDDLVVPYTKDHVKDAPRVETDGHLEPEEEDRLYAHYERGASIYSEERSDADMDVDASRDVRYAGEADLNAGTRNEGGVGHDTSGPTTDDAMTRSEERLNVGTERQATGRVRLRKYVVTENVTQTVPVKREEVRLEREPITDANRGAALSGPDISEEEHEVTLHEERPVVDKEAVPVERVRLNKETVTDDVTIDEEVRKERIETDGVDETRR
ncbi:YsnF/AvaK domain-containing protein [Pseudarthrobacter sulfonivorans]|uniref:YsnF/AvaK domain-containing protein n=1 Tax=Pseudarthrobacter sulfonivorans TaxID=121292 RepID=UPI00286C759A|nr:YsnF/AvaK domain-containing protein [Pseudarthrobacter sulfonivorans]